MSALLLTPWSEQVPIGAPEPGGHEGADSCPKAVGAGFDDAYQYLAAENIITLLSFDKDFDLTPRGRKTPSMIQSSP